MRTTQVQFGVPDAADPTNPFLLTITSLLALTYGTSLTDPASTFGFAAVALPMVAADELVGAIGELAALSAQIEAGTVDPDGDGVTSVDLTRTVTYPGGTLVLELLPAATPHQIKFGATQYSVPKAVDLAAAIAAHVPAQP